MVFAPVVKQVLQFQRQTIQRLKQQGKSGEFSNLLIYNNFISATLSSCRVFWEN
jgi:hypothetical protein